MKSTVGTMRDRILIGAVMIVVLSGALSTLEAPGRTNIGFEMDGTHQVTVVRPASPAQAAGVQSGDMLKSVNGVLITDTTRMEGVYLEAGGLPPGTYGFERGGQTVRLEILRGSLSTRQFALVLAGTFIGLVFVGFPIRAYFTAPGTPTVLLAVFGLTFGATIMGVPTYQSPTIASLTSSAAGASCSRWPVEKDARSGAWSWTEWNKPLTTAISWTAFSSARTTGAWPTA